MSAASAKTPGRAPAYDSGASVRVRKVDSPGHIRTPHYIRGKTGTIDHFVGYFKNPEELAYGRSGEPLCALYRVSFPQSQVWSDYTGAVRDAVYVDLYEHWLEPAERP